MNHLYLVGKTEDMVSTLLENLHREIQQSGNSLYKPVVVCPNSNFQNYIIKTTALLGRANISMGIEFTSIERFLKTVLNPDEILLGENTIGPAILEVFRENSETFSNLGQIFKFSGVSLKNRFDLAFALGYRYIRYQRELGSGWEAECSEENIYRDEIIHLYHILKTKLKNNPNKKFIFPEELPQLIKERSESVFQKCVHIAGATSPVYLHLESLLQFKNDIHFYQFQPFLNPPPIGTEPYDLIKKRIDFLIKNFNVKQHTVNFDTRNRVSNLEVFQNAISDKGTNIVDNSDTSLQILISPSTKREIEAVHSDILIRMEKNPSLSPGDFLILVPDLNLYSTVVKSVFTADSPVISGNKRNLISYIITDEAAGKKSSYGIALDDFFQIGLYGMLIRKNVSTLLRHTNIQIPLGITPDEVSRLSVWFDTYSFLKGLSDVEKELDEKREIARDVHSFEYFLKKIRMGLFFPPYHKEVLKSKEGVDFIPSGNPNKEDLILLEKLHRAYDSLKEWIELCSREEMDIDTLLNILDKNISVDPGNHGEAHLVYNLKNKLIELKKEMVGKLHPEELYYFVMNILENEKEARETILENGVTISPIFPVRPIPFQYIYILGLNLGNFGINPEKSPYDLFWKEETKNGFTIMQARESAKIMLMEAVFSARAGLVLGMVVESSPEKIREILGYFSTDSTLQKILSLNRIKPSNGVDIDAGALKKISELLSESGVVLGNMLEFCESLGISIPLNFIPLSRYSRFYFLKNSNFSGTFLRNQIGSTEIAVTNLKTGTEGYPDERDYLNLFMGKKEGGERKDEPASILKSQLRFKDLLEFLYNPLEHFLNNLFFSPGVKSDPNEEFDPMELSPGELIKLLIPKLEGGNLDLVDLLSYHRDNKKFWKASGIYPAGNWSMDEGEEKAFLNKLFTPLDFKKLNNLKNYEINSLVEKMEIKKEKNHEFPFISHKWSTYGDNLVFFSRDDLQYIKKYSKVKIISDALCHYIHCIENNIHTFNLYYISLYDKNDTNKIRYKFGNAVRIEVKTDTFEQIKNAIIDLIEEYGKGPIPYDFDTLDIAKYKADSKTLRGVFKEASDFLNDSTYENIQRKRKKKILENRIPNDSINPHYIERILKLLNIQKIFKDLFL